MKTATKLKKFRKQCERETSTQAAHITLPLLHVLNDMCQLHGISGKQRRRVIGRKGTQLLADMQTWCVDLKTPITQKLPKHSK